MLHKQTFFLPLLSSCLCVSPSPSPPPPPPLSLSLSLPPLSLRTSDVQTPYYTNQQQSIALKPDIILPYSDSDEDDYEDVEIPVVPEVHGRQRTESDVIDIIGSLCLEGVFQGLDKEGDDPHKAAMLPSSIRMTDNLVNRGDELDELSVMVTRNLEIVPETPFDANTGTGKSFGILKTRKSRHSSTGTSITKWVWFHCTVGHHRTV